MISLYYAATPNGQKILLFLYETDLPFRMVRVNLGKGEQHKPEFLAISPNNKIPAIVDASPADGGPPIPVFESAAILHYLAEKNGRFLPSEARARIEILEWLSWQVANLGPVAAQLVHCKHYANEKIPYSIEGSAAVNIASAITRLRTWQATRGSCRMRTSASTLRIIRILPAGST